MSALAEGEHEEHEHDHEEQGREEHGHEHGHGAGEQHDHPHGEDAAEPAEAIDAMLDAIRQARVGQLVVSSISTFASVAFGKLEAGDLAEAKGAIDVIDALLPHLKGEEEPIRRDFEQALTNLKIAYATAVSSAE